MQDFLDWYNAGNIFAAVNDIGYLSFRPGVSVNSALPDVLRSYLLFHGALGFSHHAYGEGSDAQGAASASDTNRSTRSLSMPVRLKNN